MRFEVLGPVRVVGDDGRIHPIGSRAQRTILASLVASAGRTVPIDALVDAIWGDAPPRTAVASLRSQISRLRQLVGDRVASEPAAIRLALRPDDAVDVAEFESAVAAVGDPQTTPSGAIDALATRLRAALEQWRGPPFGDVADAPTVRLDGLRLEAVRVDGVEVLARLDLRAGRHSSVTAAMEQVVAADELRESGWELLVLAASRAGRPADGVRIAHRATKALAAAGLVPGPALRQAEAEALGQTDPAQIADSDTPRPTVPRPVGPLTATIGREEDQALVIERLATERLVTLLGPGGVGKSRLGVDVARARADGHQRGAVVVDLAAVRTGDDVGGAVVTALQLSTDRRTVDAALVTAGELDQLVVIDNCEHVIDAVAQVVPRMLSGGERLRVLATSRQPLGIDGESTVPLSPLPADSTDDAAVALFVERATMAAPGVVLDREQVQRVARHLDGLPIAIEMAAARLRTMTLAELEQSVSTGLEVLSSSRRDIDPRQQTVVSLIEWSEALLDPVEREIWLAMATFAGPVTADAVIQLTGRVDAADIVARLVDQSLVSVVRAPERSHYSMLELIRVFARTRLQDEGRAGALAERHARWVRDLVDKVDRDLRTDREPDAAARFTACFAEVRQAFHWFLGDDVDGAVDLLLSMCLACRQMIRPELSQWAELTLAALPADDPRAADVRAVLCAGLAFSGQLTRARTVGEVALAGGPSERALLPLFDALGDVAIYEGHLEEAEHRYQTGLGIARDRGDESYIGTGLGGASIALAYQGRADEALRLLEGVSSASVSGQGWLWYARGETMLERDPERAREFLDRAVEAGDRAGNRYLSEVGLLSASSAVARAGDPAAAAARFVELLDLYLDVGDDTHLLTTLRNVVPLLVALGRCAEAATLFGAVADHPLVPTFGPEADRLRDAATSCRSALGDPAYRQAIDRGRLHDLDTALIGARLALEEIGGGAFSTTAEGSGINGAGPPVVVPQGRLVRRGELWHVDFRGSSATLTDLKGLHDIAVLVASPHTDVPALHLVGGVDVADAPDALLDDEARDAYRRRVEWLRGEIGLARERGDEGRVRRAEDELDALLAELSAMVGLGGRPRLTSSSYERARSTVTNRIRVAMGKIDVAHPELGRHFRNAIRTGTWCSYRPEHDVAWTTSTD